MKLLHSFLFPPEIEDQIFEHTARMHLTYAPTLALISKRVQTRVEFVIYETIALDTHGPEASLVHRFEPTLRTRPPEFFALRVHNLCITNSVPTEFTEYILSKCTGVRNLAIWQSRGPDVEMSRFILPFASKLRSLDTDRRTINHLAALGTVFPRLELLGILSWPESVTVPSLHWLPALTSILLHILEGGFQVPTLTKDSWQQDIHTAVSSAALLRDLELEGNFDLADAIPDAATLLEIGDARVSLRYRGRVRDQRGRPLRRDYVGRWEDFCAIFKSRPPATLKFELELDD